MEANELSSDKVDVAVCDGFVGNIVMKLTEGIGVAMVEHLRTRLADKLPADELDELVEEVYELSNVVETRGGGPLFGVERRERRRPRLREARGRCLEPWRWRGWSSTRGSWRRCSRSWEPSTPSLENDFRRFAFGRADIDQEELWASPI